jgi:hypothetical protein
MKRFQVACNNVLPVEPQKWLGVAENHMIGWKNSQLINNMKLTFRKTLLALAALAMTTSAQAVYVNGDLLLGFTGTGGGNDYIQDIGQFSSLSQGKTWTVGTGLGSSFGIIGGQATGKIIYATSSDSSSSFDPTALYSAARANINTIGASLVSGGSRTTTTTDTTGWTYQTALPAGTPGNTFQNNFYNPNVSPSATAYFYAFANSGTVTADSFFTYNNASGVLTYGTAVPEPASFGILALGLLAVAVRRQVVKA